MNRRHFLTLLGSAALAPAAPKLPAALTAKVDRIRWVNPPVFEDVMPALEQYGIVSIDPPMRAPTATAMDMLRRQAERKVKDGLAEIDDRWTRHLIAYHGAYADACVTGTGFVSTTAAKVERIPIEDLFAALEVNHV